MNYFDRACMHKFQKALQIHVIYFLTAGGSRMSNMTFPCVKKAEMQKVADAADISVLFFSAGANFWAVLGYFWAILAILGHFWANLSYFG